MSVGMSQKYARVVFLLPLILSIIMIQQIPVWVHAHQTLINRQITAMIVMHQSIVPRARVQQQHAHHVWVACSWLHPHQAVVFPHVLDLIPSTIKSTWNVWIRVPVICCWTMVTASGVEQIPTNWYLLGHVWPNAVPTSMKMPPLTSVEIAIVVARNAMANMPRIALNARQQEPKTIYTWRCVCLPVPTAFTPIQPQKHARSVQLVWIA